MNKCWYTYAHIDLRSVWLPTFYSTGCSDDKFTQLLNIPSPTYNVDTTNVSMKPYSREALNSSLDYTNLQYVCKRRCHLKAIDRKISKQHNIPSDVKVCINTICISTQLPVGWISNNAYIWSSHSYVSVTTNMCRPSFCSLFCIIQEWQIKHACNGDMILCLLTSVVYMKYRNSFVLFDAKLINHKPSMLGTTH